MQLKNRTEKAIVIGILIIGGFLVALPFIWMLLSSLKTESEVIKIPPTLFPHHPTFENYVKLFKELNFGVYLLNTLIIVASAIFGLLFNTMAGYAFGKMRFRGKNIWYGIVLSTMMLPGQVTMIPTYLIINELGLNNTRTGIILPGMIAAFSIFLIRQFMATIPNGLIESARIDGAGEFYIFFRLIIPLSKPILGVQAILAFIGAWNSFIWPLIIANSDSLYTLSVGLALLKSHHVTHYAIQMAGAGFMVVPILIVFIIFQRHIIEGFNMSGIK